MVKAAFEKKVGERLRDYANRARHDNPPSWFPPNLLEGVAEHMKDKNYIRRSKIASENRRKGGEEGKAPATHGQGRQNTLNVYDRLCSQRRDNEPNPTIPDIVEATKKNKKGSWISRKVDGIWGRYQNARKENDQAPEKDRMDPNEIWSEINNGIDEKGRLFGTGNALGEFYDVLPTPRSSTSSRSTSSSRNNRRGRKDSEMAALIAQNKLLAQQNEDLMKWREEINRHVNYQPPPNCPPFPPFNPNDQFDGNGGSGSGSGFQESTPIWGQ